jgi:hypothetical protein
MVPNSADDLPFVLMSQTKITPKFDPPGPILGRSTHSPRTKGRNLAHYLSIDAKKSQSGGGQDEITNQQNPKDYTLTKGSCYHHLKKCQQG